MRKFYIAIFSLILLASCSSAATEEEACKTARVALLTAFASGSEDLITDSILQVNGLTDSTFCPTLYFATEILVEQNEDLFELSLDLLRSGKQLTEDEINEWTVYLYTK